MLDLTIYPSYSDTLAPEINVIHYIGIIEYLHGTTYYVRVYIHILIHSIMVVIV